MGSGSSKEKAALNSQLDELNQKYRAALQTIGLRENQINEKERELEAAKREAAETRGLKERVAELEKQITSLREEKQREVSRLQDELSKELSGQLRVAESLTQERNLARKEVGQLREKLSSIEGGHADAIKKLEDTGRASTLESDSKRTELEKELQAKVEELTTLFSELKQAKEEKVMLEENVRSLDSEKVTAQAKVAEVETAKEQLSAQLQDVMKRHQESEKARDELTAGSRTVNDELAAAKAAADGEVKKQTELGEQLANTRKQVAYLESTRDNLQKQNNEGISKRSALHEAFQATKIELSEWVEGYKKLQGEKKGVDEKVKTLEQEAKASSGSSEDLERAKKELKEQGEKHSGEREDWTAQLAAVKKTSEAGDADKKALLQEVESAKKAAADAEESRSELQRELDAAKKQAAEFESLRAELDAAKKQAAEAEALRIDLEAAKKQNTATQEASTKRDEEQQAEIVELRKALREAKDGQAKRADEVDGVETPRAENDDAFETPFETARIQTSKQNGYFESVNGNGNGNGLENGHAGEVKLNGETTAA